MSDVTRGQTENSSIPGPAAIKSVTGHTNSSHCVDCCCAQSWKALGVTKYTGLSIPEHIERLRAALKDFLEQVENLDDYQLTRDLEPYKAQAVWDDVLHRASEVLGKNKP